MSRKIRITFNADEDEFKKFIENVRKFEGSPKGTRSRGLNAAIKLLNNYFEEIDNITLFEIANQLNMPPWKVGAILIRLAIPVYQKYNIQFFEYCLEKGVKSEDEHLRLVDEFFKDLHDED